MAKLQPKILCSYQKQHTLNQKFVHHCRIIFKNVENIHVYVCVLVH